MVAMVVVELAAETNSFQWIGARGDGENIGATPVAGQLAAGELRRIPADTSTVKAGSAGVDPGTRVSVTVGGWRVCEKRILNSFLFPENINVC